MNLKILKKKTNKLHKIISIKVNSKIIFYAYNNNKTKWEKDKVPYRVSLKKVMETRMSTVLILLTNKYK
jgi:hypothetical protein